MTTTEKLTASEREAANIAAQLRARQKVFHIITKEEARVESYLIEAAASANYEALTWDVSQGVLDRDGNVAEKKTSAGTEPLLGRDCDPKEAGQVIEAMLKRAQKGKERNVLIMRDLNAWLTGPANATTLRSLRNFARFASLQESGQAIIILTPDSELPKEIAAHTRVTDWPLPDRDELGELLDLAVEPYTDEQIEKPTNGTRDAAVEAAIGLSGEEAQACFARSIVQSRKIDPATIAQEKKRVISAEGLLEWYDPLPYGLDGVGGLENIKSWLKSRTSAYSPAARAYGLPAPRGIFVAGISGCGKSLLCKAIATAWGFPLIRVDLNALKSKYVGEAEQRIRKLFRIIEAIGRCIVWLDEIEKALAGAIGASGDSGVSADALGVFLTWMQERKSEAFVIATANEVKQLPPELLRKGRFDEIWWVDLPTSSERASIIKAAIKQYNAKADELDADAVAEATKGFTGSEIAALVPEAMFAAFNEKARNITTDDLTYAASTIVPLSETAAEKIAGMREYMKGRARAASAIEDRTASMKSKKQRATLDI